MYSALPMLSRRRSAGDGPALNSGALIPPPSAAGKLARRPGMTFSRAATRISESRSATGGTRFRASRGSMTPNSMRTESSSRRERAVGPANGFRTLGRVKGAGRNPRGGSSAGTRDGAETTGGGACALATCFVMLSTFCRPEVDGDARTTAVECAIALGRAAEASSVGDGSGGVRGATNAIRSLRTLRSSLRGPSGPRVKGELARSTATNPVAVRSTAASVAGTSTRCDRGRS